MKIVVIGGTGLIGSKTVAILRRGGHEVLAASVPFDYGPGPNNRKRIKNAREEAIETNEHQSVDGTEGLFLGGGSSQNNDLLPQR